MMKKVLLFVYDSFAEFEIAILATGLSGSEYELVTFSAKRQGETAKSEGGLKIAADLTVNEINLDDYEALIIPGGSPHPLFANEQLLEIIRAFYENNKLVAAICGGPGLLGAAGILDKVPYSTSLDPTYPEYKDVMHWDNKSETFLTIDQNVITATGSNYLDFAEAVLRQLGVIEPDEEDPLQYFRVPSAN